MDDVRGRVAVITGASRGIGAGVARALAARGLRLGLCARSERGPSLPEGADVLYRAVDVTDFPALRAFAGAVSERFGRIDLWINNAGLIDPIGPVRGLDPAAMALQVRVNLTGVLNGCRIALEAFHRQEGTGALINVGSGAATSVYEGWGVYCATKAAVHHLTRVVAAEERPFGHRIFALCPGVIESGMHALIRRQDPADFPLVERFREMHRDGVLGHPGDPAPAILRLAFGAPLDLEDPVLDVRDSPELRDLDGWR